MLLAPTGSVTLSVPIATLPSKKALSPKVDIPLIDNAVPTILPATTVPQ